MAFQERIGKIFGRGETPPVVAPDVMGERTPERQFVDAIDSALYALKQRDPRHQTFRSMHFNGIDFGHRDAAGRTEHYFTERVSKDVNKNPINPFVEIYVTQKGILSHSRKLLSGEVVQLPDGNKADVERIAARLEATVKMVHQK